MSNPIIEVDNISKLYHLGLISSTTLRESVERWWFRRIGKEEALNRIGTKRRMIAPDDPQAGVEPNTLWALKDISFKVERGEVVGIIGRNGSGKSTLLKILSRITEPTDGEAIIRGRHASMLEVGTGFHQELTGRENVYLNGTILGMRKKEIKSKFDEIVAFAELEKFIDTPVKRYSSGMYVRLAFAVAAHLEPEILIVDEVLAVGDAVFQKKCLGKMGDVAKEGKTILFVSHSMVAMQNLCTRGLLFNNGLLVQSGDVSSVVSAYLCENQRINKAIITDLTKYHRDNKILVESIGLFDIYGNPTTLFSMGDDIVVKIIFKTNAPIICPGFNVRLNSEMNVGISAWRTSESCENFPNRLDNSGEVDLIIKELNILNGTYNLSVAIFESKEFIFFADNFIFLEVAPKKTECHINVVTRVNSIIYTPCEWKILLRK